VAADNENHLGLNIERNCGANREETIDIIDSMNSI